MDFGEKSVRKSPAVESGSSSGVVTERVTSKKYNFNNLSYEQKQAARDFERMGVMKVDDYIKSLVELGELK
jgi:hypothetical protein